MKKLFLLCLACFLVLLAGCQGAIETGSFDQNTHENEHLEIFTEPLPEGMMLLTAQCRFDDRTFLGGFSDGGAVLGYAGDSADHFASLPDGTEYIYAMCGATDKLVVLAGSYPLQYLDVNGNIIINDNPQGRMSIFEFDKNGSLLGETPLAKTYTDMVFSDVFSAENGDLIAFSSKYLVKINAAGEELNRASLEDGKNFSAMRALNGEPIIASFDNIASQTIIYALAVDTFEFKELGRIDGKYIGALSTTVDGRLLVNDIAAGDGAVYSFDIETGDMLPILFWDDIGIAEQEYSNLACTDGRVYLFSRNQPELRILKYVEGNGERKELVVATDSTRSEIYTLANKFNAKNKQYKISVVPYGNADRPIDMLKTEITAGKSPDIFAFYEEDSLYGVEDTGLFEDLFTYLDSDDEYNRDTIIPSLLSAMSTNGQLFWLPYDFSVSTFYAQESVFGAPGLTIEEMEAAVAKLGGNHYFFPAWMTRDVLFSWISKFSVASYVDAEGSTCNFDDSSFVKLLEICNEVRTDGSNEVSNPGLLQFELLQNLVRVSAISQSTQGDYSFVGFPNESTNGSIFTPDLRLAISSTCKEKDAAWQFVRTILDAENQPTITEGLFPAVKSVFDGNLDAAVRDGFDFYGNFHEISEQDAAKLRALVDDTVEISGKNSTLLDIIEDNAASYFSGKCTAEEAAKSIQSRATLYLSEQR